jgi:hypothetical protein
LSRFPKSNIVATPPKLQNDVDKFYELEKHDDTLNLDVKKSNPPLKPRTSRSSIMVASQTKEGDSEKKMDNADDNSTKTQIPRKSVKSIPEVDPIIIQPKEEETVLDKTLSKNLSVKKQLAMKRNASNQSLSGANISGESNEGISEPDRSLEKKKETPSLTKLPNFLAKKPSPTTTTSTTDPVIKVGDSSASEEKKEQPIEMKPETMEEKPAEKPAEKNLSDKLKMRAKKNFK